jgi:hypothetical protein
MTLENIQEKMRKIRIQEPFIRTMRIKELLPLENTGAISGETFHIIAKDGKEYKLRYCDSLVKAWRVERSVNKLPGLFPKFYGREGRYLMFEWLPGGTLTEDTPIKRYEELGILYGQIHELDEKGDFKQARKQFDKIVAYLLEKGIIEARTRDKIISLYDQKSTKVKHAVVLEYTDLHLGNVMVNPRTNRLVLIDEEGLNHKVKGLGMMKAFLKWFTKEQHDAFMRGYGKAHDTSYFNQEYEDFIKFYFRVRDVYIKAHTGREYGVQLQKLMQYLEGQ